MIRAASLILVFITVAPLYGAGKKRTEAENLGFLGPIKSVLTTSKTFMEEPKQPDGYVFRLRAACGVCEFDREGNETRSGTRVNGKINSTTKHVVRDEQGRIKEKWWKDDKGEVVSRVRYTYGPAGNKRADEYRRGKLFNSVSFVYDSEGNLLESEVYGPDNVLQSANHNTFDDHGNEIESLSEGPGDNYYDVVKTYDPESGHLRNFTSLNRDGTVRVRLTMNDHRVLSYWQQPGDKPTYGSGVCFSDDDGKETDCRNYKSNGTYLRTHYVFTDKSKRLPVKGVRYGENGHVMLEADYDFQLDRYGNWTQRTVWIRSGEQDERKLFEKDSRTLTYYSLEAGEP